jgi:hypothetical protein
MKGNEDFERFRSFFSKWKLTRTRSKNDQKLVSMIEQTWLRSLKTAFNVWLQREQPSSRLEKIDQALIAN